VRSEERDLSDKFRKVRLATLGKRRECLPRFAGLQALAKQRAFAVDLGDDPVPVGNSIFLTTDIESGDAPALCERFVA
jgi:hypothetical protein